MEFEQMKKIWDDQQHEQMYAINGKTLHRLVLKKNVRIKRMVAIFEWTMLLTMLGLALLMIIEGIIDQEYYQLPEGGILLIVSGFIYWDRRNRIKYQNQSNQSLLGDLEQGIRMIEFHATRERKFVWFFVLPLVVTTLIHAVYTYDGKPWWLWLVAMLSFAVSYWLIKKELRTKVLPKKKELEALRRLLQESGN